MEFINGFAIDRRRFCAITVDVTASLGGHLKHFEI
jgi:hypothetical protein